MTARSQKFQKRGICTCLVKKIQFGKISAPRLVITAEKALSHCDGLSVITKKFVFGLFQTEKNCFHYSM
jgi:hypothetical protein